jgi:hypothetical protein
MKRSEHIRQKVLEHLVGPIGSILLHALLIFLAVHFIVLGTSETKTTTEITLLPEKEPLTLEPRPVEPEPVERRIDEIIPADTQEPDPTDPGAYPEDPASTLLPPVEQSPVIITVKVGRPDLPPEWDGRTQGPDRPSHRTQEPPRVRSSVILALEWLRLNQNEDGSWSHGGPSTAMTGLGLLTFLSHGVTVESPDYGDTVTRAMRYLMAQQRDNGQFNHTGSHHVYGNAIATYALAEAAAMTLIPSVHNAMNSAVQALIDQQQPGGGWDYDFRQGTRRDTSVSAFIVQALKAAAMARSEVEGIDRALELAIADLRSVYNPSAHSFGYTEPGGPNVGMTAIGVLLHQMTGHGRSPEARAGAQLVGRLATMDWEQPGDWPLYRWYYVTQVMFQSGGPRWDRWNRQFSDTLVNHQNEDGSWTAPGGRETAYGPVYATTLAALTLQVYHRLLLSYDIVQPVDTGPDTGVDDVVVKIPI